MKCKRCENTEKFMWVELLGTDRRCYLQCEICGYRELRFSISQTKKLLKYSRKLCAEIEELNKKALLSK
jgi:uncharacterized radical SAM superfamily protein